MTGHSRRSVIRMAAAAGAGAMLSSTGLSALAAGPVTLRFATAASGTDIRVPGFQAFADAIKDFATFEPHYNATLFQQGTEPVAIQRGNLEMAIVSPADFAKQIPAFSIFAAGYLIRDPDHLIKVFDSDVGAEMYKMVEDQMGFKVLTVIYAGTRQLNLRTDKQINVPADLAGVKLRMPATEGWQFLGRALGASPTPMALGEVYTGLQTGAIDGQDNPLPTVKDSKFYEVTKQIVLTSHTVGMDFLVIGKKVYDAFPPEQQKRILDAARTAFAGVRQTQVQTESDLGDFFKSKGLKVYKPDVDAFRKHVQEVYLKSDYVKDWPKGMLERINAI
jgi:tripartite ATP-independent transporter DctP family solute receptor